jgi:hypothetical protein
MNVLFKCCCSFNIRVYVTFSFGFEWFDILNEYSFYVYIVIYIPFQLCIHYLRSMYICRF